MARLDSSRIAAWRGLQALVGQIERAVLEDVDLHARQDPEVVAGRSDVGVDGGDLVELLGEPLVSGSVTATRPVSTSTSGSASRPPSWPPAPGS